MADQLPCRKRLFHTTPQWVTDGQVFFITVCCKTRNTNQLCQKDSARAIFNALEFYQGKQQWFCRLVLLMPDHLHGLFSFPNDNDWTKKMTSFKRFTAKNASIKWQDGFFDHRIRKGESISQKAEYIINNPIRAGLISDTSEWAWIWRPKELAAIIG